MFVYVIVNSANLKIYVGQHKGQNLQQYLQKKWYFSHHRLKESSHLYAAMRKHPRSVWSIHPLISNLQTVEEVNYWERVLIKALKTQHPAVGYNIADGGSGFTGPFTEETRRKIGDASRAWHAELSEEERQEHNRKISAAQIGKIVPPEQIEKMRQALLGIPHTEEHCKKQSQGIRAAIAAGHTPHQFTPEEREKAKHVVIETLTGVPRAPEVLAVFHSPAVQAKAIANSRATNKGKKKSPEICAKVSEGKKKEWATRQNRTFSLDRNAKISDTMKGRAPSAALALAHSPAVEEKRQRTRMLKTIAWG